MKTLHLTNAYHATSGGIRTFYRALLQAAEDEGREMVLVVPGARSSVESTGRFGRIYTVEAPCAPAFDRRYRIILPHRYFPVVGRELVGILERERPALVEICDKYSLPYFAAMLRKRWHVRVPRPVLVGLSCERFDDNMAAYLSRSSAARAFTRWYVRHVYGPPFDCHIANSEYTAQELLSALPDRPPGFVRVCPMGVDTNGFGPERRSREMRARLLARAGGHERSVLLLYAGRVSPEKNLGLLVEMLRELVDDPSVDYRLVVAGDGPRAEWLRGQTVGALDGRICLTGNLDRETLATVYASCDVFVHPNAREPFGIGPLEAMASGVPVVVPACGGVLEYATPLNAWLAAPAAGPFARAVRAAAAASPARLAAARATAHRFRWSRITRRFFATYDELQRLAAAAASPTGSPLISSYSYVISKCETPKSRSEAREVTRVGTRTP